MSVSKIPTTCRDCRQVSYLPGGEFFHASAPRCSKCGGLLDANINPKWRPKQKMTAYKNRHRVVKKLGFSGYAEYLKSEIWAKLRKEKLSNCPECELCGKAATQVHHLSYSKTVLRGKTNHKLVSLCGRCHYRIEFFDDGDKRSFELAMKYCRKLLRKRGRWEEHKGRKSVASGIQPIGGQQP